MSFEDPYLLYPWRVASDPERITAILNGLSEGERGSARFDLVAEYLSRAGFTVVEAVVVALGSPREVVRLAAIMSLLRMRAVSRFDHVARAIVRCLADPSKRVRRHAADALSQVGAPSAETLRALVKSLEDKDEKVREAAGQALAGAGGALVSVRDELHQAMTHRDIEVRCCAARALSKIPSADPGIVSALFDALEHRRFRSMAVEALGRLRVEEAVEPLLRIVAGERCIPIAMEAEAALARIGIRDGEVVPLFHAVYCAETRRGGASAVEHLQHIDRNPERAIPGLMRALSHRWARIRVLAAGVLGAIGPLASDAIPALRSLESYAARHGDLVKEAIERIVNPVLR